MVNCTLNDMLARIRNGIKRKKSEVTVIKTKFCISVCKFLVSRGILNYVDASEKSKMKVGLKYFENKSLISEIKQVGRPSAKGDLGYKKIRRMYGNGSFTVVSTKEGIKMQEYLLETKKGGRVLFIIYF
jgi:small subunit ribosomal protein S8